MATCRGDVDREVEGEALKIWQQKDAIHMNIERGINVCPYGPFSTWPKATPPKQLLNLSCLVHVNSRTLGILASLVRRCELGEEQ